jgi:hypothetical protein
MGHMSVRKKISDREIKRRLIAEANDPSAWESPITVPAGRSPRPAWYGRSKHLELAAKFYVLSVLHRLGVEANLTYAQPDSVDITAVRQSGEAFTIDVKTLAGTKEWSVEPFSARKHHFLVFVCFNQEWRSDPQVVPEIFIWSSERLKALILRAKVTAVSLQSVATKLDPNIAWDQFTAQPAA